MLRPFFVWQNKKLKSVSPTDVLLMMIDGNYTRIQLLDKTYYMVRSSLASALKQLPEDLFIKTHRAYAVSILHIDTIARDHLVAGKHTVPISRKMYKSVMNQLNIID
jgi:DNA-binding LytR/AlgR family response regulator